MNNRNCNGASMSTASMLAGLAVNGLHLEIDTWPKPGLVSHVDNGAHKDMDAALLHLSAETLLPYYIELAQAGARNADMDTLRKIGIAAEEDMLQVTGGVNTHRGAIFGLGLLVAAAGLRAAQGSASQLGTIVAKRWGQAILDGPRVPQSNGTQAIRRYAVGGAREQAARGFPALYHTGLCALHAGRQMIRNNEQAARVQACFALIAMLDDTNLLHRGGATGLRYAQQLAGQFIKAGGVGAVAWERHGVQTHHRFVERNLSPGGAADLLGMTVFVDAEQCGRTDLRSSLRHPEALIC